jgi:hypothetical protein
MILCRGSGSLSSNSDYICICRRGTVHLYPPITMAIWIEGVYLVLLIMFYTSVEYLQVLITTKSVSKDCTVLLMTDKNFICVEECISNH